MTAFGEGAISVIASFYPYRSLKHKTRIEKCNNADSALFERSFCMNILTTMGCVQKHHPIMLGCHSIFVYVQWTIKIEWLSWSGDFWTQSSRESRSM